MNQVPLHEIREASGIGLHRIITFHTDGTPDPGKFVSTLEIATHKSGLFACADPALPFPPGLFRVKSVAHQTL